ncbi:hypothetical protein SAMN05421866_0003 [Chryseobacterium oranimense]|uniref:Uncharacterized protein n=1 Tax=Chryseobacterium oranimense TaxID=421058 RepID=A0A1M5X6J1_9FLAO|nr:hypothetical protein [Chryseobacterium oranimense]SHH95435.1 hypothetical protein SAMN05421866_0003 [Chryseobacterium oranimense]
MRTFKIKLSNKEILVTEEDIKIGMHQWNNAYNSLIDSRYEQLKKMNVKDFAAELENMSDADLLHLAKENDEHVEFKNYNADDFTIKIRQELFKRKGLGYKQLKFLSKVQRSYLETLGLKNKY